MELHAILWERFHLPTGMVCGLTANMLADLYREPYLLLPLLLLPTVWAP